MEQWSKALDFAAIGDKYATPRYIFNPQQLHKNVAAYVQLVGSAAGIAYPVKANPALTVLHELGRLGCSADCAGEAEVSLAQEAGIPLSNIIYNTPCPDKALALFLLAHQGKVVIDSLEFLEELAHAFQGKEYPGILFLRINPALDLAYSTPMEAHKLLAHGASQAKFGIPAEELLALPHLPLNIQGLHLHIGSRMDRLDNYIIMLNYLHEIAHALNAQGQNITWINLGGGLGIPFHSEAVFPEIESFADALHSHLLAGFRYMVEPGNSLVGNTMGLLTRVVQMKKMRGKRWGILDVGCDQLINQIALKTPHQILNAAHEPLAFSGPDSLGGPLCFAGDVLLPQTDLSKVAVGDVLFIQHTGAYCYALGNHFNGRYLQGILTVDATNQLREAHAVESLYQDLNHATYNPFSQHIDHLAHEHSGHIDVQVQDVLQLPSILYRELAPIIKSKFNLSMQEIKLSYFYWDHLNWGFYEEPIALKFFYMLRSGIQKVNGESQILVYFLEQSNSLRIRLGIVLNESHRG